MKVFLTILSVSICLDYWIQVEAQQAKKLVAPRSRLSNSIESSVWQSPSQLSQINSNRMDWSAAVANENLEIFAPSSRIGLIQSSQKYQVKGGYLSRYPFTASGRLGIIVDAGGSNSEGYAYIANQSGQFRTHLLRSQFTPVTMQKFSMNPIISYSFWDLLSVGASLEMNRRSFRANETKLDFESRTLHAGLSLYTSGFETALFASIPQSLEVRDASQPNPRFRAISNAEAGGNRVETAGALIRANLISEWNLGYSRRWHQIRTASGAGDAPTVTEQRYMLEFAAEAGTLEAFMEMTQNFAVEWQDPEFYAGSGKRIGGSLMLKTMGNARYGFSMDQTEQIGVGTLDQESGEHEVAQKSTRIQILGYMSL
jgi:hypothetical protein